MWVLIREEKVRVRGGEGIFVLLKLLVLRLGVRWEGIFITSTCVCYVEMLFVLEDSVLYQLLYAWKEPLLVDLIILISFSLIMIENFSERTASNFRK